MRDHIKILGVLNIVMGSLTAVVGLIALLAMGTITGIVAAGLASSGADSQDRAVAVPIIATIGFAVAIFFFALGLPSIIGGWGLLHYRPWSRILMTVVSFFHLFHIPLGTALGVYGLWVLLNGESQRILESGGVQLGPAAPVYAPTAYAQPRNFGSPPSAPPS